MSNKEISVMDNIRSELNRKGITAKEFCNIMGVTPSAYRTWLKNGELPTAQFIKCAKLFDCTLEYLARDVK